MFAPHLDQSVTICQRGRNAIYQLEPVDRRRELSGVVGGHDAWPGSQHTDHKVHCVAHDKIVARSIGCLAEQGLAPLLGHYEIGRDSLWYV